MYHEYTNRVEGNMIPKVRFLQDESTGAKYLLSMPTS